MALGGEVHDRIEATRQYQRHHYRSVGDVPTYEAVARLSFKSGQVVGVAGVGQRIEIGNLEGGVGLQLISHEVRAE